MDLKCNPVQNNGDRNLFCPYYGDCLDYAITELWNDWDCGECQHKMRQDGRQVVQFSNNYTIPYYELMME